MITIRKTEDTTKEITTMTEVLYYDLHIIFVILAKKLTQGATEVRVKMTQIFLQYI